MDFETTNEEPIGAANPKNEIICVAWQVGPGGEKKYAREGEFGLAELRRDIRQSRFLVAHNAKFELQWLHRMGEDLGSILVYDTMLGEYVLAGNRLEFGFALDVVGKRWIGIGKEHLINSMMEGGVNPRDMPEGLLRDRVLRDVDTTVGVFLKQREELKRSGRLSVAYSRNLLVPVLAEMEFEHLALDQQRVDEEYTRAVREYNAKRREFEEFTGGINPRSVPQVARFLYDTLGFRELTDRRGKPIRGKPSKQFPDGQPKTDEKTVDKLSVETDKQRKFVELRREVGRLNAEITKSLEFFHRVLAEHGGKFRGIFNQTRTRNHRLSSSGVRLQFSDGKSRGVQFQNFPRKFKDLLRATRDGWYIGEVDQSGAEFRAAGFLTQDPQIAQDIRTDADIHRYTTSVILSKPESEVTKVERNDHKEHTFKPLYGGQSGTEDEVRYYRAFQQKYHVCYSKQTEWTYEVLGTGRLVTPWGLVFYWSDVKQGRGGYISHSAEIFNYPVSCLATAEMAPISVVHLWHRIRRNAAGGIVLVNTIHDSAVAEVRPDMVELWVKLGIQTFTVDVFRYLEAVYGLQFNLPLGAGVTVGKRWQGDIIKEVEINVERNGEFWRKGERAHK